jgi:hypothetical protein
VADRLFAIIGSAAAWAILAAAYGGVLLVIGHSLGWF